MRRSFGGNRGGGGNMLRTLSRTVQELPSPTSPTDRKSMNNNNNNNNNNISLSSPSSSPFSTSPTRHGYYSSWRSCSVLCDDFDHEWFSLDDDNDDGRGSFHDDGFVLGPAPSRREAQSAVTALQQVIETASFTQLVRDNYGATKEIDLFRSSVSPSSFIHTNVFNVADSDWAEPSLQQFIPRILESRRSGTVYDAFHLLQTDPSVQRMVISLSSDPAVWNAVLNNAAVREVRRSISPDDDSRIDSEGSKAAATSILKWILGSTKAKAMEILKLINKLVNDLFQPHESDDGTSTMSADSANACFDEKLRCSLMLTVMVLLIVAVDRAKRVQY